MSANSGSGITTRPAETPSIGRRARSWRQCRAWPLRVTTESGIGFAFPSRTVYFSRDTGLDGGRTEDAEAEVRRWRAEKRSPFPQYDFAERAEMTDTLPFPPEGSPDFQPSRQP
jgi:hypothetical protein